jgi:hypothetical protein
MSTETLEEGGEMGTRTCATTNQNKKSLPSRVCITPTTQKNLDGEKKEKKKNYIT